jgi:glycine/D-amino acid oxidase-like deaminating enzyme
MIVGQGLCGTFLSWNLIKSGKKVLVIDASRPSSSTKLASGVINPVTGRRIVRTWEIETLLPFAWEAYTQLGKEIGQDLIKQCNILDFHPTPQMELAFRNRLPEETEYLRVPENPDAWRTYFDFPFGIGEINPCLLIDLHAMLIGWRKELEAEGSLLEENFQLQELIVEPHRVSYGQWEAEKIIFCDGTDGFENPYFQLLPYAGNKGEVIIASIPDLPRNHIYKQGINLVPWKEDLWWIGSNYEWDYQDLDPSQAFREKVEQQLKHWLKLTYTIVDHQAAVRPANMERRPFVGLHPVHSSIGVFNGMGTKGCSLSPYFGHQFTQHLLNDAPLNPLADVQRFKKILSR